MTREDGGSNVRVASTAARLVSRDHRAALSIFSVLATMLWAGSAAAAAYSFRNPFNGDQCARAIRFGQQLVNRDHFNKRGQMIVAEGLLCKGLDDDPWALEAAITLLKSMARAHEADFFVQLDLADALRKRFPASREAQVALQGLSARIDGADVGAARQDLREYIAENLAAIADHRARVLRLIEKSAAAEPRTAAEVARSIMLLIETGQTGVQRAQDILDSYLTTHHDDALETLYRGELLRGRGTPAECRELYAEALAKLCTPRDPAPQGQTCSLVHQRLRQLERARDARPYAPTLQREGRN